MKRAGERGEQKGSAPVGIDLGVPGCEHAVEIGRGGFGAVYRAWQPEFGRTVAVKVLGQAGIEGEARRRLARELRAMGALSGHPHIVTVHSAGFTGMGNPYLVMGFEPSGTLADRLRRSGPMPWEEAVLAGIRISGALETAHRAGLLHRDVKPENVLLSAFGEPKLADFGVAQLQGAAATTARTPADAASVRLRRPGRRRGTGSSRVLPVTTATPGRSRRGEAAPISSTSAPRSTSRTSGSERTAPPARAAPRSSSPSSSAERGRSSGLFAIARSSTSQSASGTPLERRSGTGLVPIRAIIARLSGSPAASPANAGRPRISVYTVEARA